MHTYDWSVSADGSDNVLSVWCAGRILHSLVLRERAPPPLTRESIWHLPTGGELCCVGWFLPKHLALQQRYKSRFPGNISVLELFSIESSLKAISSDYGSNKERNVHLEMRNLKQTELHRLMNRGKKG